MARSCGLGNSAAAAIGYAKCIELPWENKDANANPGPGAYTADIVESKKSTRSPASAVYKSRSPRFRGEVDRSPGAAAYSPRGHEMANYSDSLSLKMSAAFASESARELQLIIGEVNPIGPGQYESCEQLSISADIARSASLKSASFGSLSPRFRPPREDGPGPSDYSPRKKTQHPTTHAYSIHASF